MAAIHKSDLEMVTANVELSNSDWRLHTTISVPKGPMQLQALLPAVQTVADAVVNATVKSVEESGQRVSCKKGCGACCRQLVPISEVEAHHIRDIVNQLPEPRRSEIKNRFAEAHHRLDESGLLEKLLAREGWSEDEVQPLGLSYFFLGIPCPFLQDESCSIYADRPLSCREYLVTSPAANCARPSAATIEQVKLPFKIWPALARLDKVVTSTRFVRWVPLILAPQWADTHPAEPPERPGPELLRELFAYLSTDQERPTPQAQTPVNERPAPVSTGNEEMSASVIELTEMSRALPASTGPDGSSHQNFPLRIGSADDFARVASILRAAHFDEPTICRMFEIENMSDVDSAKRKKIDLAGCLGFFIKTFLFLESIPPTEVARWLEPSALDSLRALDLIRIGTFSSDSDSPVEMYYSTVWLYPVAGYLIASDRRNNPDGSEFAEIPDIVFPAIYDGTFRFLRIFSRRPAEDALELCSGSGIAALVLSRTVNRVVASDLTARAAHFAQFNRRLNHCMNVEIAQGDLYSAVEGRSFDRIVAHPPYVPAVSEALIYRDSGETGETLIRRIIAGLPDYLRPGGTFYSVCEGWDAKEGLFEERVRSWLGKRQREFDIIFALQRQLSPDEVAGQVVKLEHSSEDSKTVNWRELFRSAGLENRVYGALVLHRREAGTEADASSPPVTRRLRLGESTEGASFEWALRWYSWRNRKEASGNLAQSICRIRPRLSPNLQAKVTHAVQEGSLVPTDIVFETELPFPTASRIDLWMMQMLANFDGQLTTEAVYAAARKTSTIPESFGLKDFAMLVANMIERGCLDVENHVFES